MKTRSTSGPGSIERSTFERLVHEHHREVWRSARRVTRSDADALDATQDVFLRVLDGRLRLEPDADERRVLCWWSIRIATNAKRGARRRREREQRSAREREHEGSMDERTADGGASARDEEAQLWGFVESLPDELRVPLVLRFGEGCAYAEIGSAVGVAESTAHERVRRALTRLRELLTRAGLAALALDLETRVARAAPANAPVGLADTLLGLRAQAVATSSSSLVLALVAATLVVGGAMVWQFGGDGSGTGDTSEASASELAALHGEDSIAMTLEPTPSATRRPAERSAFEQPATTAAATRGDEPSATPRVTGRVTGRVVDALTGPLADCRVSIFSIERAGKQSAFGTTTATDADGWFSAEVELADERGGSYRAQVVRHGYAICHTEARRVEASATTDFGELAAVTGAGLADGPYSLDLEVLDAAGRPLAGARVELASCVPLPVPPGSSWPRWLNTGERLEKSEASKHTDPGGRVRFEGELVGGKAVRVWPPDTSHAPAVVLFDVASGDAAELVVALEPGQVIAGRLSVVDHVLDSELTASLRLHIVERSTGVWMFPLVEPDGRFRFTGLPSAVHRVVGEGRGRDAETIVVSSGWLDIEAGSLDVEFAFKRADDIRDVGVHAAEIHGRFVRAADGEPVSVGFWDVDIDQVHIEPGVDLERDWMPNHVFPRPVQRAAFGPIPQDASAFQRTGLAAGTYLVRCATDSSGHFVSIPIVLGEREIASGLVFALEEPAKLVGTVLDPDGVAVDGAHVFLTGVGPLSDATIASADRGYREADGRGFFWANGAGDRSRRGAFELGGLPGSQAFRVVALHPGFEPVLGPVVTFAPGEVRRGVELRFAHPR